MPNNKTNALNRPGLPPDAESIDQSRPPAAASRGAVTCLLAPLLFAVLVAPADADLNLVPGMTPPQAAAAAALQDIYDTLGPLGGDNGTLPPDQQAVFEEARDLVHTSNEQQGSGPIEFSLNIDEEGLRDALQWNASEELNNPGTAATKTLNGQQANLVSRLAALRHGASGFSVSGLRFDPDAGVVLAANDAWRPTTPQRGGAAGADAVLGGKSGGFLNGAVGFGSKDPTPEEDAFDYVSYSVTGGLDHRYSDQFVAGVAFGYSALNSNFDSGASTVDGKVNSEGVTMSGLALYQAGDFYFDGIVSLGYSDYAMHRSIQYASNNPLIPGVDETAKGDTDSREYSIGLGAGYERASGPATFGGYVRANYLDVAIDGFRETGAGSFNLEVDGQDITSLVSVLGGNAAYAISSRFGVFLPQVKAEWHHEFDNDRRDIRSRYIGVNTAAGGLGAFDVPTENPDRDFAVVGAGVSSIFRNGFQAFFQYDGLFAYEDLESHLFTLGIRREF